MPIKKSTRIISSILLLTATQLLFVNCTAKYSDSEYSLASTDAAFAKLQGPGAAPLRRMSNAEYTNSLKHAVEMQFKRRSNATNWVDEVFKYRGGDEILRIVPMDNTDTNLSTNQIASSLAAQRFSAYLKVARTLGRIITDDANWLKSFAGTCASDKNNITNQVCVNQFVNEFGLLTFRSPVTSTELAEIKKGASNWNDLIARLFSHPRFLVPYYRSGAVVAGSSNVYELTDYERAAKLASVFWKSIPDLALLEAAGKGLLKTDAGLKAEIQRVLDSPKSEATMWEFYKQWLGEKRIPDTMAHDGGFEIITGLDFNGNNVNGAFIPARNNEGAFKNGMRNEASEFLSFLTWKQKAKLETLFTSPLLFPRESTLASIYGVTARVNVTDPPITDQTGNYKGILSRPFVTTQRPSGNGDINPIQRGYFLALNVMGIKLGNPVNFGEQEAIVAPPTASTSHEVRLKTNTAACISCHQIINPAGFALSHYNTVGQWMATEKRYNNTTLRATNPVDAKSSLSLNGKYYQIDGLGSFVDAMIDSGQLATGFSSYYFEFTQGRTATPDDQQWINRFKASLRTKSLYDALTDYGMDKDFVRVRAK